MESRKVPALLALAGVVVAVGLFLLLNEDTADEDATLPPPTRSATGEGERGGAKPQNEKPAKPEPPLIEIRGGQPVGGVRDLKFDVGDAVKIEISSDAADEVHLHVYDVTVPIPAGGKRTLEFKAEIDGVYELESHTTGALLAEISIEPS